MTWSERFSRRRERSSTSRSKRSRRKAKAGAQLRDRVNVVNVLAARLLSMSRDVRARRFIVSVDFPLRNRTQKLHFIHSHMFRAACRVYGR